ADLLPTLAAAAGAEVPAGVDGRNLLPLFRGEGEIGVRPLFFEHFGSRAVRQGRWKLVADAGAPWQLYDLRTDRAELRGLSATHPDTAARLAALYDTWADAAGVLPLDTLRARWAAAHPE
ncbi:MAG: hypothetical protein WBA12_10250, partial [Catalinimonas sp.]